MMKSTAQLFVFLAAALLLNIHPNQSASSSVATAFQLRIFETLSTSTTPNNNSHTTLMTSSPLLQTKGGAAHNNGKGRRQQQLAATSSSSTPSETTNAQHSNNPASKALQSIRTCYKTCLFSTAVDFIITLIDGDQPGKKLWSKLFLVGNNNNNMKMNNLHLRWTDYVDIFDSLSLLVFALGLYRVSKFYEEWLNDDDNDTANDVTTQQRMSNDNLSKFFSIMNWIWRIVAVNFALGSLSIASALPTIGASGPFDFIFRLLSSNVVSSSSLVMVVVTALVIGYSIINLFCDKVATIEDENDDKRISSTQRQSKSQLQFKSIREQGYGAYCSQALCAGSFGIYSCMELSKWVVAADSGIVGRALSFGEWVEPFAMTTLLIGLNRAFLRAAIVRSRDESKTAVGMEEDEVIYNNLFTSQVNFYTKVAEVVKGV